MTSLLNETRALTKEAQGGVYTTANASTAGSTAAQHTVPFPRRGLGAESSRDELMKEKMEFLEKTGDATTPFGIVTATDEDFKWLQRKRDTEAAANLDAWISQNFHVGDVTTRKWLQEVYPEYYAVREQMMMDRAKFALRVQLLLLRGPKNHKDLILLWGLQTGQIQLDRDWDRIGPTEETLSADKEQERFQKGLFNPLRYLSDDERKTNQGGNRNPFNPGTNTGTGGGQIPGPFSVGGRVESTTRYPSFLSKVLNPSNTSATLVTPSAPPASNEGGGFLGNIFG